MNVYAVKIIAGFISTLGFGILFKIKPKLLPFSTTVGLISCCVYFGCIELIGGDFLSNALAALFAALIAELFARLCKAPATVFLLPGVIPLVPGGPLYYVMSNLISQNYQQCLQNLILTLKVGIGIGGGIIASSFICYLIEKAIAQIKINKSKKQNIAG